MIRDRRMVASLATALGIVVARVATAQGTGTVRGHVTAATGEPLIGASISATGTQRGAITRSDGAYQLTLVEGRYELHARLLGYAERIDTVTVRAGEVTTKDFRAERVTTTLESVAILG